MGARAIQFAARYFKAKKSKKANVLPIKKKEISESVCLEIATCIFQAQRAFGAQGYSLKRSVDCCWLTLTA